MHPCALTNGQFWQVGPNSQPPQAALHVSPGATQQAMTANNPQQYIIVNLGGQPQQSAHFTSHNGAYANRQTSNWPTSAGQVVSSHQTTGRMSNNYYSSPTMQNRVPPPYGFQAAVPQGVCQNSATRTPPNNANLYPPQHMVAQSVISNERQTAGTQDGRSLKGFHQNSLGGSTTGFAVYNTTSTSHLHSQQTAHAPQTQNHRQNATQSGSSPAVSPPSYNTVVSQYFGNKSNATQSSSNVQAFHVSRREVSRFLDKANGFPSNPAVPQQQMLRREVNVDSSSYAAGSNGPSPVYAGSRSTGQQFASMARMPVSNQNMQPVTSAFSDGYNLNASRSLPLRSGQAQPNSPPNVMPRAQHVVNAPPQQNPVPDVISIAPAGDGCGRNKADNATPPQNNRLAEGNQVASQQGAMPVNTSPQANDTMSFLMGHTNILKLLLLSPHNNSPIHSSSSHTGARAVAVVQPLPLENGSESPAHPEKVSPAVEKLTQVVNLRDKNNLYPENPTQMKSLCRRLSASSDDPGLSASVSGCPNSKQKSTPDVNIAPTAQRVGASEVPVCQNDPKGQSEMETPLKPPVSELSSLPTTPWTPTTLRNLMQNMEKAQTNVEDLTGQSDFLEMIHKLWGGPMVDQNTEKDFKDTITQVKPFLREHLKRNSVILLQVKGSAEEQLESYRVLKDGEVYSEQPYKSSWLNVNQQLDDIDKIFGFPWALRSRLHVPESDSPTALEKTVSNMSPAPSHREAPNEVLSQTELEPVKSGGKEQASAVKAPAAQSDNSSDPYYSFNIQVLSPETAKLVFEEAQSQTPQSTDTDSPAEKVKSTSVESEVIDATSSESRQENEPVRSIEQVCCVSRWVEIILGSNTPFTECLCKKGQSNINEESTDKEKKAAHDGEELCEISSDGTDVEGESPAKEEENVADQIMTFSFPELYSDLGEIIDITDNNDKSQPSADRETNSSSSWSGFILISDDDEGEDLLSSENETPNRMPDLGLKMSEPDEERVHEQPKPAEDEGHAEISAEAAPHTSSGVQHDTSERKQKRLCSSDGSFPSLKESKKCKRSVDLDSQLVDEDVSKWGKVSDDAADAQPVASNVRTAKLALFGSRQGKRGLNHDKKRRISSAHAAPELLYVTLNPVKVKRKSNESGHKREYLAKLWMDYEKWRLSKRRIKYKIKKCSSAPLSGTSFHKGQLSAMSEKDGVTKLCLSLKRRKKKRRRRRELGEEKTLARPDGRNTSHDVSPVQENSVLRFSVLPSTFNFKDGSSGRKETTSPDSDKPDCEEEMDQGHSKAVTKTKDAWGLGAEKKDCSLHSPPEPKTSSLFEEFKRRYREKFPSKINNTTDGF